MSVVKEFSTKHCKKVRIHDDTYAHLSEEEIRRRNQYIQDRVNMLARTLARAEGSIR